MGEMTAFLIVSGIAILFYVYSKFKQHNEAVEVWRHKELLEQWILMQDGVLKGYRFSSYNDNLLSVFPDALIIVGIFKEIQELKPIGFLIEIYNDEIRLEKIFSQGIVSHHKTATADAKLFGCSLYEVLCELEISHNNKNDIDQNNLE